MWDLGGGWSLGGRWTIWSIHASYPGRAGREHLVPPDIKDGRPDSSESL